MEKQKQKEGKSRDIENLKNIKWNWEKMTRSQNIWMVNGEFQKICKRNVITAQFVGVPHGISWDVLLWPRKLESDIETGLSEKKVMTHFNDMVHHKFSHLQVYIYIIELAFFGGTHMKKVWIFPAGRMAFNRYLHVLLWSSNTFVLHQKKKHRFKNCD